MKNRFFKTTFLGELIIFVGSLLHVFTYTMADDIYRGIRYGGPVGHWLVTACYVVLILSGQVVLILGVAVLVAVAIGFNLSLGAFWFLPTLLLVSNLATVLFAIRKAS